MNVNLVSSDEDDELQIVKCTLKNNKSSETLQTIDLDEEPIILDEYKEGSNSNGVIEIDDSDCHIDHRGDEISHTYDSVYKKNNLLADIIERCLNLESSEEMSLIINRKLLPLFNEADKEYIQSMKFQQILIRTITKLQSHPRFKFTHLRQLCENLKANKFHIKKKVPFVTLKNNLSKNSLGKSGYDSVLRNRKIDVISLVDDNDNSEDEVAIVGTIKSPTAVIDLIATKEDDSNSNKENVTCNTDGEVDCTLEGLSERHTPKLNVNCNYNENIVNENVNNSASIDDQLLVPHKIEDENVLAEETLRIQHIEEKIAHYKDIVNKLELREVNLNDSCSAYIQTQRYKKEIVRLYKELCEITGEFPVKQRRVRLGVIEGHAIGPVRKLEEFINNNIESNGDTPFPDYTDVVDCVIAANNEEGLGWDQNKIYEEARLLFTQCGRALQKRRQIREWRHVKSLVKEELVDPADEDPELMAKLARNRLLSRNKEKDLLKRFSALETRPNEFQIQDQESLEDDSDRENVSNQNSRISKPTEEHSESVLKHFNETECGSQPNVMTENNSLCSEFSLDKVKPEPIDIPSLLESLGPNFTTTVMDIEDPFLVIEISSDDGGSDVES